MDDNCTENGVLEKSDYIDIATEHTHVLALSQLNQKEHLISCTEAECLYVASEPHSDTGNGYCSCGYEVSLIAQDKRSDGVDEANMDSEKSDLSVTQNMPPAIIPESENVPSENNAIADTGIKEESGTDGELGYYQDRDDFEALRDSSESEGDGEWEYYQGRDDFESHRETFNDSSVDSLIEDVDCLR